MKGTLARLGIRNFKPTLRKAAERLATLHTPEGSVLPPNVSGELQRLSGRGPQARRPGERSENPCILLPYVDLGWGDR